MPRTGWGDRRSCWYRRARRKNSGLVRIRWGARSGSARAVSGRTPRRWWAWLAMYDSRRSTHPRCPRPTSPTINRPGAECWCSSAPREIRELAPGIPVYDIRTLASRAGDAMSYARFSTILLALFGIVALALATLGTYGVISFGVAQRTREIGIRVALGARRGDVVRLIVGQGLRIAAAGAAVGLVAALAATRVMRSLLYDVAPSDPVTFAAIVALLGAAALLASWIPARRAARVDPVETLREG